MSLFETHFKDNTRSRSTINTENRSGYQSPEPLMLTLCLEEDSILVGKAVLDVLEHPKQMQMLINDERKMLLLQACTVNDREAVIIPPSPLPHFEISGHSLLKRIRRLTGWTDDLPRVVYGQYIESHSVVIFDLMMARPAQLRSPLDGGAT